MTAQNSNEALRALDRLEGSRYCAYKGRDDDFATVRKALATPAAVGHTLQCASNYMDGVGTDNCRPYACNCEATPAAVDPETYKRNTLAWLDGLEGPAAVGRDADDHVRRQVGRLAKWLKCLSYNESYAGEPPGEFKSAIRELAKAVDPIYPPNEPDSEPVPIEFARFYYEPSITTPRPEAPPEPSRAQGDKPKECRDGCPPQTVCDWCQYAGQASRQEQDAPPTPASGGEDVRPEPEPNWCRTCGGRPNSGLSAFCPDAFHRAARTAAQEKNA